MAEESDLGQKKDLDNLGVLIVFGVFLPISQGGQYVLDVPVHHALLAMSQPAREHADLPTVVAEESTNGRGIGCSQLRSGSVTHWAAAAYCLTDL